MTNWELHIEGQVQGVGFRPTVYRVARQFGLHGNVSNGNDGVRINFTAEAELAQQFQRAILANVPAAASITNWRMAVGKPKTGYSSFRIIESETTGRPNLIIPADLGICEACRSELFDRGHRHHYAYTSCTNCGPRYSIIKHLPYDRSRTSMSVFTMCGSCKTEYENPNDRRHHSQTNSCPDCAVNLLEQNTRTQQADYSLIQKAARFITDGQIVAIKGIGGYLLCCAADKDQPIQALRDWKHRPDKPLALMYPSQDDVTRDFLVCEAELRELNNTQSPIVLLKPKPGRLMSLSGNIAPGLDRIGIMLPYTPLFQLLLSAYGQPIIATSGNQSGRPITYRNDAVNEKLGPIAQIILADDRELLIPQDDSVLVFTENDRSILLRRSRGFAPTYFNGSLQFSGEPSLAVGADLKGSFGLQRDEKTYLSQNLGDLASFECEQAYRHCLAHLKQLTALEPAEVIADLHPAYTTSRMAQDIALSEGIPLSHVQHHEAHFAAVIGENDLIEKKEKILGVIWDGTGWGHDDQLWGGEFMTYARCSFQSVTKIAYSPVLAGDKMAREPRLSALSLCRNVENAKLILRQKFSAIEWSFYQKALARPSLRTSSMGRLFDAVACILGLVDRQSYEGMAASRLEVLARQYTSVNRKLAPYPFEVQTGKQIDTTTILAEITRDLQQGSEPGEIAFRFHLTLVEMIRRVATKNKINALAFSGGVFQNSLLVNLIEQRLNYEYQLYFHRQLSPNDENIAFGQLVHREISRRKEAKHKTNSYVLSNSGQG